MEGYQNDASVLCHNPVSLIQGEILLLHVLLVRDTGYRPSDMATMLAHSILSVVLGYQAFSCDIGYQGVGGYHPLVANVTTYP